jgi:hypothetical protein
MAEEYALLALAVVVWRNYGLPFLSTFVSNLYQSRWLFYQQIIQFATRYHNFT